MEEHKLLTEAELLRALNIDVDRTTVWHWRSKGMPHVKVGRAIRYDLAAVQQWLKRQQLDLDRIAQVAAQVLLEQGATAVGWTTTPFDRLQVELHNRIMTECPRLGPEYRFRIGSVMSAKTPGHLTVSVTIERVQRVGEIEVELPPGATKPTDTPQEVQR